MNPTHLPRLKLPLSLTAAAVLAACVSAPLSNARLDEARSVYQQAAQDPVVARSAPLELQRAQQALTRGESALRAGDDAVAIEHHAYLARQQATIALTAGQIAQADQAVTESQARRDQIVLQARTREVGRAVAEAEQARVEADRARKLAEDRLAATRTATATTDKLRAQLEQMKAKQTERGLVLTLGDVLFDSGRAELKPGAMSTIDRLAEFMRENPERKVSVEGHTDSVGSSEMNRLLSQRRAEAVRSALVQRGVNGASIATQGLGDASPVASNDSAAGRQRNRRIEIVISGAG